jgi:hypothetical protein
MKSIKTKTFFYCGVKAALICLLAVGCGSSEKGRIQGTVLDITPDFSDTTLSKLEAAKTVEESGQILQKMVSNSSQASGAVITARSVSGVYSTTSDSKGRFEFTKLPNEEFDLEVKGTKSGNSQLSTVKPKGIYHVYNVTNSTILHVRSDFITVKGRITDTQNNGVPNVKILGEAFPLPESSEATPPSRTAVSGPDGSFEISGITTPGLFDIVGYLNGCDLKRGDNPFFLQLKVEAEGYERQKTNTLVPLVSEQHLAPARRVLKVLSKLQTQAKGKSQMSEKDVVLPKSQGYTISDVHITLQKLSGMKAEVLPKNPTSG